MHRCLSSSLPHQPLSFLLMVGLVAPELGGIDGRLVGPELGGVDGRLVGLECDAVQTEGLTDGSCPGPMAQTCSDGEMQDKYAGCSHSQPTTLLRGHGFYYCFLSRQPIEPEWTLLMGDWIRHLNTSVHV